MDERALWTDLRPRELAEQIAEETGTRFSDGIVRRLLKSLGCGLGKIAKVLPGGESPDRDAQFCYLGTLIDEYLDAGRPVLSMDTKKKEFLGNLYRDGRVYCNQPRRAYDHDFPSWASGVLFDSLSTVVRLMSKTATQTGLSVTVRVLEKLYETGRKASDIYKAIKPVDFDDILPRYNYRLVPEMYD